MHPAQTGLTNPPHSRATRLTAWLTLVCFVFSSHGAFAAGAVPVADSTAPAAQTPTVNSAASVPVINIAAPNASGLSHNQYQSFDVPTQGAVLNNATSATTTSLTGATVIPVNANLGGTSATVILNEVRGTSRSQLLGTLEVAGQAARIIIANPNGITCDGCGFINTPQVQLTTGTPVVEGGVLTKFDVLDGTIEIKGQGLQGLAARLDLVSYSLRSNANVSITGDLNLIIGRQYVAADSLQPSDPGRFSIAGIPLSATDSGYGTAVAIVDISQSVSANTIRLVMPLDAVISAAWAGNGTTTAPVGYYYTPTVQADLSAAKITTEKDFVLLGGSNVRLGEITSNTGDIAIFQPLGGLTVEKSLQAAGAIQLMTGFLDITPSASVVAGKSISIVELDHNVYGLVAQFRNQGTVSAGQNLRILASDGDTNGLVNTGTLSAGATFDASGQTPLDISPALQTFSGPAAFINLVGPDWDWYPYGFKPLRPLASVPAATWQGVANALTGMGVTTIVNDNFIHADGDLWVDRLWGIGSASAGGNAYVNSVSNNLSALGSIYFQLTDPYASGFQSGSSGGHVQAGNDIVIAPSSSQTQNSLFNNQGILQAGRDIIASSTYFYNGLTLQAGRDIAINSDHLLNQSTSYRAAPQTYNYEAVPGCLADNGGACDISREYLWQRARVDAGRHIQTMGQEFGNVGGQITAAGDISINAGIFQNTSLDLNTYWSAYWFPPPVSVPPAPLLSPPTNCSSGCASLKPPPPPPPLPSVYTASGTFVSDTIPGTIQAGGAFLVSGTPVSNIPASNSPAPASGTGGGTGGASTTPPVAAPPAATFTNTGTITASVIDIHAEHIVQGTAYSDQHSRTAAPAIPAAVIALLTDPLDSLPPTAAGIPPGQGGDGAIGPDLLSTLLPAELMGTQPFALTGAQEQTALRQTLLDTVQRAWIIPDPANAVPGLSADAAQHAILLANAAAWAIANHTPLGTPLTDAQISTLAAPMLWYETKDGQLTPTLILTPALRTDLAIISGGLLKSSAILALQGQQIDNTGFITSEGLLRIEADSLANRKRLGDYSGRTYVDKGYWDISGKTVQPGGFLQAAAWELDVHQIDSISGEFNVTGADQQESALLTAALQAQLQDQLGDNYQQSQAQDQLTYKYACPNCKAPRRSWSLSNWVSASITAGLLPTDENLMKGVAAQPGQNYIDQQIQNNPGLNALGRTIVVAIASYFGGPYAGAGAAATWDQYYTYQATGDINAARKTGAKSFAISVASSYVSSAISDANGMYVHDNAGNIVYNANGSPMLTEAGQNYQSLSTLDKAGTAQFWEQTIANAGVTSVISGTSFESALKNNLINQASAQGANWIGDGVFGEAGSTGHALGHAALGAIVAKARGQDPVAGAIGGLTEALLSPAVAEFTDNNKVHELTISALAVLLAQVSGHDGVAALQAAQNADQNNRQLHTNEISFLHDKARIARYMAHKKAEGQTLTEAQASQALDRFGAAMVDEKWTALYGRDASTEAFIRKEAADAKLSYVDSKGVTHLGFSVTNLAEYKDETINLRRSYDAAKTDKSVSDFWVNQIDSKRDSGGQERYDAAFKLGQSDAKSDSSVAGDRIKRVKEQVSIGGYIWDSLTSDRTGYFDDRHELEAHNFLRALQGRQAETGYLAGRRWEDLTRTALLDPLQDYVTGRLLVAGIRTGATVVKTGMQGLNTSTKVINNNAELLDRNGVVVAVQDVATGEYRVVVPTVGPKAPQLPKPRVGVGSAANNIYSGVRPMEEVFPELKGVNPHYVENADSGVNTNCASCVNATQQRLTGQNPKAVADPSKGYANENSLLPSAPFGFGQPTTPAAVIAEMQQAGDGAARPLIIIQPGNVRHVVNVVNRSGQIYFVDPQLGKVVILQPDIQVRLGNAP